MRWIPVPFALLALAACGPEPTPVAPPSVPAPPAPPPLAIADEPASAARIGADVTYLASPELAGRGTGDPGGEAAAKFVLKRFRDLGLLPAAAKDDYLQPFSARVGAKAAPASLVTKLDAGAKKRAARIIQAAVGTADGSASGTAAGPAVFVGYGITAAAAGWDDYAGADLGGKIAVILDGSPPKERDVPGAEKGMVELTSPPRPLRDFGSVRYKIRTAREHKAAGAVIVLETSDRAPEAPADASSMGLPAVVVDRASAARFFPSLQLDKPRAWRPKKPSAPVNVPVEVEIKTQIDPVEAPSWNVIGLLPARADAPKRDEYVIVGAHYDHLGMGNAASRAPGVKAVHPGADDNASGTALLLEVARRFAALPQRPNRNLLFMAFGAEEVGAIGSRHWTQHPTVPLDKVVAMLNADMVGRMQKDHLMIDGVGTSPGWKPLVEQAKQGLSLDVTLGGEGFGASDHASFTAVRVPVAFFFTGAHPDYHMPSDTADKIDAAGAQRVATLAARLALAVAQAPDRLPFVDAPADPHRGMRGGFKVSLGTIPDYAHTGKGLRLDGVRPDAPAARAGLRRGDVIVKVGSHEIGNIHDFMFALGELEPGREVVIVVEREGKRLELKAIPAPGK